jgi:hypothetical protein
VFQKVLAALAHGFAFQLWGASGHYTNGVTAGMGIDAVEYCMNHRVQVSFNIVIDYS